VGVVITSKCTIHVKSMKHQLWSYSLQDISTKFVVISAVATHAVNESAKLHYCWYNLCNNWGRAKIVKCAANNYKDKITMYFN